MSTTIDQHQREIERLRARVRLQGEMWRHIGRHRAIGMAELYEIVYGETWLNRINDTRKLRKLITELRRDGSPICSIADQSGGGYYLAQTTEDLSAYLDRQEHRALKILARNARMKQITLPEYLGQMSLHIDDAEVDYAG